MTPLRARVRAPLVPDARPIPPGSMQSESERKGREREGKERDASNRIRHSLVIGMSGLPGVPGSTSTVERTFSLDRMRCAHADRHEECEQRESTDNATQANARFSVLRIRMSRQLGKRDKCAPLGAMHRRAMRASNGHACTRNQARHAMQRGCAHGVDILECRFSRMSLVFLIHMTNAIREKQRRNERESETKERGTTESKKLDCLSLFVSHVLITKTAAIERTKGIRQNRQTEDKDN